MRPELAENSGRLAARSEIIETLSKIIVQHPVNYWVTNSRKVVCLVHRFWLYLKPSVIQAVARDALWDLDGQNSVANALRFMSKTPAESTKGRRNWRAYR